jgi:salicylate hydroxylase
MTRNCDVAIVGGGIGGLTLAASLLQQSLSVQIFEQDTELREIGAGIAIGGNATRLLQRLGVDLEQAANMPSALEFRCWRDGRLLWSHPIGEWYRQEVGAPYLTLHRATLQRLLAAAVPSGFIQLNHRVVGLSGEPDGVRLRFAEGSEVVASVVVGADGVNSTVRRYICGDVAPTHSGEIGFRAVIPIEKSRDLPNPTSLHCWCGPDTHVVYYGLESGKIVNLLAVYKPRRLPPWTRLSNRVSATRDQALSIFEEYSWDPRILDLVRNIEGDMSLWALVELPRLPRWSRGRVILLGDAAHAPLPHQGQGAGLAIEDAYALGSFLADAGLKDYGLAFAAFEKLRMRRAWRVQAYSRVAGRAYKSGGDTAARRDASWPSLPHRIGWIHKYREEEMVPSRSDATRTATYLSEHGSFPDGSGRDTPLGRGNPQAPPADRPRGRMLACDYGRAIRQSRRKSSEHTIDKWGYFRQPFGHLVQKPAVSPIWPITHYSPPVLFRAMR